MQRILQAKPSEILIAREPQVIHADLADGSLVCAYHGPTQKGACVLLRSQTPTAGTVLNNMLKSLQGLTKAKPEDFSVKVLGKTGDVDFLRLALQTLNVSVEKELKEDLKTLEAYFYSDSGRLRVGEKPGAAKPETVKPSQPKPAPQPEGSRRRRVLIVDDSKTIRTLLTRVLSEDPRLEVVGAAERPSQVHEMIEKLKPDVLTLDIHMPEMDGVTLLKQVMPRFGLPVVMITSVRREEGPVVLQALELGAIDYIQKPSLEELDQVGPQIAEKVFGASHSKVKKSKLSVVKQNRLEDIHAGSRTPVICIGSSTGGTEALRQLFSHFPAKIPPVLIVQHIPAVFSTAFATRLNEIFPFEVREAVDGDEVLPNRVIIAPGGKQMKLRQLPGKLVVQVTNDGPVNRHKPSVDYLFDTCATILGKKALGVILTGMGADGAKGLLAMKKAGAKTIVQDESTSVVYGMPRAAHEMGAADEVRPLDEIPYRLWNWLTPTK